MTAKNEADRKSEAKRRRKRTAVNKHLYRQHNQAIREGGMWHEEYRTADTARRLQIHAELHRVDDPNSDLSHEHLEAEDWEELERLNGD